MYNGIGLPTPRGSGTNGFVQRNMAHIRKGRLNKPDIVAKPDANFDKPMDIKLLTHQKKREIQSKCLTLKLELEDRGWRSDRIEKEVERYKRKKLEDLEYYLHEHSRIKSDDEKPNVVVKLESHDEKPEIEVKKEPKERDSKDRERQSSEHSRKKKHRGRSRSRSSRSPSRKHKRSKR